MPFLSALDSTKYNALRGNGTPRTFKSSQFMCILSNSVMLAARVNQSVFTASFAQITFDTVTEGAYTNVGISMLVLISHTSDKREAYFEGRVRYDNSGVVSTATVLNINETSETISDNDYLWVIRDVRPYHELGAVIGGVYKKDYARTFFQLKPIISGLQSAYAGIVSGSPVGFTVSFAAVATAATAGATISSYTWTIPSGGTVTAGSASTANVTVRFDASATEYWVKLVVLDSGSRAQTRYIPVWAVPADLSTTVVRGFTGAHIEGGLDTGWSATVDAFDGVEDMLDGTLCCIFDVEYYQETAYSLFSTVKFVGRFRKESNVTSADETYSTKRKTAFEIEGTAAQLARISSPEITARDASSPAVWDEIKTLTIWRAITYLLEHSTFHQSFSLTFDSTANTFRAFQLQIASGSQLDGVKDLAQAINAVFEFAPTGEARVVRDARYGTTAERNALTTIANLTASDWINFSLDREYFETVGLVEASGGTYTPTGSGITAAAVRALLSIAPGVAQGNGDGTNPLPRQILSADVAAATAQGELNTRAGNHFAASNPTPTLNVDMRGAYNWLIPSANQWYTWTIGTSDNRRDLAYTTSDRWLLKSVSIDHDNVRGNKSVSAQFMLETSGTDEGVAGQTVVIPPQDTTPPSVPPLPPFDPFPNTPPLPDVYLPPAPDMNDLPPVDPIGVPLNGNAVITWSEEHIWATKTFITTPIWVDITPDDLEGTIRDVATILYGAYLLSSDGVTSWLYYIENCFGAGEAWSVGEPLDGEYTLIVTTDTAGSVYVEGAEVTPTGCADAWIAVNGTITERTSDTLTVDAEFVSGSYHLTIEDYTLAVPPDDSLCRYVNVIINSSSSSITTGWWPCGSPTEVIGIFSNSVCVWAVDLNSASPFNATFGLSVDGLCGDCTGTTAASSAFSDDYGATWDDPQIIDPTGGGGMDTEKIGNPALAGGEGQVKIATTKGGSYGDYGDPLVASFIPQALVVPRKTFAGGNNINTNTPDYLIASSAVDGGGETMYKVTTSGTTETAITKTISGNKGLALSPHCVAVSWWSSSYMAAVLMFGSLPRLITSIDAGATWSDRGVLDTSARAICFRKGDTQSLQLFLAAGQPAYSPNRGASVILKAFPADYTSEPVIGIAVFG